MHKCRKIVKLSSRRKCNFLIVCIFYRNINASSALNITYTAMHGVGEKYEVDAFNAFSLKPFISTKLQV